MRSKLTLAFACACALGVALVGAATIRADSTPEPPPETTTAEPQWTQHDIQREIDRYRHETWRWQRTMGRSLTRQLQDTQARPEPAAQAPVALHPSLRRCLDRSGSAVLRRPADGSRLPARLRRGAAHTQGHGESLDAPRADVGCRASAPCRPRVLSLAPYGALLRIDLAQTLDVVVCTDVRD